MDTGGKSTSKRSAAIACLCIRRRATAKAPALTKFSLTVPAEMADCRTPWTNACAKAEAPLALASALMPSVPLLSSSSDTAPAPLPNWSMPTVMIALALAGPATLAATAVAATLAWPCSSSGDRRSRLARRRSQLPTEESARLRHC